jgi:hypothetical protein
VSCGVLSQAAEAIDLQLLWSWYWVQIYLKCKYIPMERGAVGLKPKSE